MLPILFGNDICLQANNVFFFSFAACGGANDQQLHISDGVDAIPVASGPQT